MRSTRDSLLVPPAGEQRAAVMEAHAQTARIHWHFTRPTPPKRSRNGKKLHHARRRVAHSQHTALSFSGTQTGYCSSRRQCEDHSPNRQEEDFGGFAYYRHKATSSSTKKTPAPDMGLLRLVQQGAALDKSITKKTCASVDNQCEFCGEENVDICHVIWFCTCFREQRKQIFDELKISFDPHELHPALRHGLAPSMAPFHNLSFWGHQPLTCQSRRPA